MANLAAALAAEIARIARKEARAEISALRREVAELRRRLAEREKSTSAVASEPVVHWVRPLTEESRRRAEAIKEHRLAVAMSAWEYGRLAGVSGKTVLAWEAGKHPGRNQQRVLSIILLMTRREARERFREIADAKSVTVQRPAARKRASRLIGG